MYINLASQVSFKVFLNYFRLICFFRKEDLFNLCDYVCIICVLCLFMENFEDHILLEGDLIE